MDRYFDDVLCAECQDLACVDILVHVQGVVGVTCLSPECAVFDFCDLKIRRTTCILLSVHNVAELYAYCVSDIKNVKDALTKNGSIPIRYLRNLYTERANFVARVVLNSSVVLDCIAADFSIPHLLECFLTKSTQYTYVLRKTV